MRYDWRRLDKLLPALTAQERVLLILKALKEDHEPDLDILRSAPREQAQSLARYLFLIRTVNEALSPFILYLEQESSQLELLLGQMDLHRLRVSHVGALAEYIALCTKEPITDSEYRRLAGAGKGRRKSPRPDWGSGYDVFPDDEADKVRHLQQWRQRIRETLQDLPVSLVLGVPFPAPSDEAPRPDASSEDVLVQPILRNLRQRIPSVWRDLRAVELLIEETAAKFGGADPAHPDIRRRLRNCSKSLVSLRDRAQRYVGTMDLPEPQGNELGEIGRTIEEVENHFGRKLA